MRSAVLLRLARLHQPSKPMMKKRADHHTRQFVRNSDDVDFAVSWSGVVWFGCFTKSALLGGTLQSVGQVVAGASLLDAEIVKYAMLFKIARIILLVVVVLIFERMVSQQNQSASVVKQNDRCVFLGMF